MESKAILETAFNSRTMAGKPPLHATRVAFLQLLFLELSLEFWGEVRTTNLQQPWPLCLGCLTGFMKPSAKAQRFRSRFRRTFRTNLTYLQSPLFATKPFSFHCPAMLRRVLMIFNQLCSGPCACQYTCQDMCLYAYAYI